MTQTLADRISFIHRIERQLSDCTPESAAWLDAQRVVVRARADYWDAMGQDWDRNHAPRTDANLPDWMI
jgi:hypothetical protein